MHLMHPQLRSCNYNFCTNTQKSVVHDIVYYNWTIFNYIHKHEHGLSQCNNYNFTKHNLKFTQNFWKERERERETSAFQF